MVNLFNLLRCPIHGLPLTAAGDAALTCPGGETFPVIDGIPVMLPDEPERRKLAKTDWSQQPVVGSSPLDFYNQSRDQERYYRTELPGDRETLDRLLADRKTDGPVLEIGPGRGVLQGIGGDYVAIDYGFTVLRRYVSPAHARVCGTADRLPFADAQFSMLFTVAVLEHVPAADRAFAEIHRVLKPGGVAYVAPAWHCVQYNCEGIPVRPYRDLTARQKWAKFTLPLRTQRHLKALATLPGRLARRAAWTVGDRTATNFRFRKLRADYAHFWCGDSDACSRLDSHEGCLFFHSRGYDVLSPGSTARRQLLCGHQAVVVRKPVAAG